MTYAFLLAALLFGVAPQQSARSSADRLRWVPNPTVTTHGWVSDPAHHLSSETVRRIDSTIFALERATSDEMAVVVIDSLDGLEPADAALLLHRRWGVGKRDRNNGIVFLWSPALRKVYVSVGYRLEGVLPDGRVGRIEDEAILPRFRAGDFDGGVLAGVIALAATAAGDTSFVNSRSAPAYHPPTPAGDVASTPNAPRQPQRPFWPTGIFLTFGAAAAGFFVWRARRPPPCPNGHGPMRRLPQEAEAAKLSREEQLEEELKSVNYDVWVCRQCPETIVIPHNAWFSSYRRCERCGRRTSLAKSTTLVAATQLSEGLVEVTTDCRNCGAHDVTRHTTPRLPPPSTSSSGSSGFSSSGSSGGSSGGSSFGGGSAGGGGAGRSY